MLSNYKIIQLRDKCIGCNACVEAAPMQWRMSKIDGKSLLIGSKEKKGFFALNINEIKYPENVRAMKNCPVKIIQITKLN